VPGSLLMILIGLAVGVVGLLAYASMKADTFEVSRSVPIRGAPEDIFLLINDLRSFNRWNPFLLKDPAARLTYRGPPQGLGAAHDWDGNSRVGKGSVEITDSVPNSKIVMALDMVKPMAAHNRVEFTLEPKVGGTTVTWAMSGRQPLMGKLMSVFIDCDKMVGAEFEAGLGRLKAIAEVS
jgi:uncharacterized protein YndB with AHSA1/START domain